MKTKLFIIATFLLLCGQNLLHSQENWQYLDGLNDYYLWKVYAQSPDTVYITGASSSTGQGLIAKSTNGGINWTKTFTTTNNVLKDIVFYNKNIGFTIGEKGTLLKTTNGGADWTLKTSGTTQNLNAIALAGLNNIWAVGDGGVVIHSIDEGETWQNVDLQLTDNLNDIAFKKDTGYIAGNRRVLYKTINNGSTWGNEGINVSNDYLPINYSSLSLTNHNVYIMGDEIGYAIYKKNNTPTWEYNSCLPFSKFIFTSDSIGYGVNAAIPTGSSSGAIVSINKTSNSGKSWLNVYYDSNFTHSLNFNRSNISIVNDTVKYIVSGSTIFKSTPSTPITALKESLTDKAFVVIPNPLKSKLTVRSNLQPISLVELFSVSGNKLSNQKVNSKSEISVDISDFPVGVYLAKVTLNDKSQTICKWIKQ